MPNMRLFVLLMFCLLFLITFSCAKQDDDEEENEATKAMVYKTNEGTGKSDDSLLEVTEEKKVRKVLKKKRRKLRKLRVEVRQLREQLLKPAPLTETEEEWRLPSDEAAGPTPMQDLVPVKNTVGKKSKKKWRRKIMKQLRELSRRLDKLEKSIEEPTPSSDEQQRPIASGVAEKENSKNRQRWRRKRKHKQRRKAKQLKNLLNGKKEINRKQNVQIDESVMEAAERQYKISTLHSAYNRSMRGRHGFSCSTHQDCKPGLCCHKSMNSTDNEYFCMSHHLEQGLACTDSCQCSSGLHCFASAKDKMTHKKTIHSDVQWNFIYDNQTEREYHTNDGDGKCKKASADDILHGTYMNAKGTVFVGPDTKM